MSDALSEDGSEQNDSQEDVMTPVELIAKLEEVILSLIKFSPVLIIMCKCNDQVVLLCQLNRRYTFMSFQAWLNEKFSPDLLENKSEVVECVMEQLTHMVMRGG